MKGFITEVISAIKSMKNIGHHYSKKACKLFKLAKMHDMDYLY